MKGIGIIGCGKIAQVRHIPELSNNPDAKIIGYYNPTVSRAVQMARQYGGRAFDSIEEMLADKSVDAVVVCLANHAHAKVTIQALEAGKDVLCEKPMATTIEDCEAMVAAAERTGKALMIAQNLRLVKAHQKARQLIADGAIGKVLTFRTTIGHGGPEVWSINPGRGTWFFNKEKAAMGAMADLGIHKTDLIQYLLGENVVRVSAVVTTLDKTGEDNLPISVEDNAICIYTLENGVIGTMAASWTYYGIEDSSTIIYGTDGIMKIFSDPDHAIQIISKRREFTNYDLAQIQTNDNQTYSGMADFFVETLNNGMEVKISGKEILSAMRAVFAAFESSETGRAIDIPLNRRHSAE